jgi:hypothetical protein
MVEKSLELQNIFRLDKGQTTGPTSRGATHAWQVRVFRDKKHRSKTFSDSKYGSTEAALQAAKLFRNELFKELGINFGISAYTITDTLQINNKTGIVGVNRSESLESNAEIREVWQTTFPAESGGVETASFSVKRFGEIDAMRMAIEHRMEGLSTLINVKKYSASRDTIKRLIDKYLNILCYLEGISPQEEDFLIKTILDKGIKNTTKEEIINGRVGQGTFKDKLMKLWGGCCNITGATSLLNASHIKPWADCTNGERLDPFNGFLLSPVYDRAFDEGFITFTDEGDISISSSLGEDVERLGINRNARIENISPFSLGYLKYHREHRFGDHNADTLTRRSSGTPQKRGAP